jgi:hypothetical protein
MTNTPTAKRSLLEIVAWGGVLTGVTLAGIGVTGIVGFGSALAMAGTGILILGTMLTEIAASRMPVEAQRRAAEGGWFGWVKAGLVAGGFAALTGWNVMAEHMGASAINTASVADKRAPIEKRDADAKAALASAEQVLTAYDAETQRRAAARLDVIMGADGRFVTARNRAMNQADHAADEREAGRAPLMTDIAAKQAAVAQADIDLRNAPNGRPDHELWAFALILELIKGALVWFATPVRRRIAAEGNVLPIDPAFYAELEAAGDVKGLEEIESRAATAKALAQHPLRRLRLKARLEEERKRKGGAMI